MKPIIEGLLALAAVAFIIWLMWGVNYGQRKYEKKGNRGVAVVQARLASEARSYFNVDAELAEMK